MADERTTTGSAGSHKTRLDAIDMVLFGGTAVMVDLLGLIPGVGEIISPLGIIGFRTIFYFKGVQSKTLNALTAVGIGAEIIPVVSEVMPGCTAYVFITYAFQKIEEKAAKKLKKLAPAAEIAKKIPVPQVQAVARAVSAANKVVNEGQDVKTVVASEAAGLAGAGTGAGGAATASATASSSATTTATSKGAQTTPSVSGQAAAAEKAKGGPSEAVIAGQSPYAEGSPLIGGGGEEVPVALPKSEEEQKRKAA